MKACVAVERNEQTVAALTLGDVFLAAAEVSEAEAPAILESLFASGRVRFCRPDAQRELDALSFLLAPTPRAHRSVVRMPDAFPRSAGAA